MKNLIITILIGLFNIIAISGRTLQDSLNSYFEYYKIDYKYSNYKKYYSSPVIDISKELRIIQENKPRPIRMKSPAVGIYLIVGSICEATLLATAYCYYSEDEPTPNFIRRGTVENTRFNVLGIGSAACLFTSGVITCIVNKRKPARYRNRCIEYNRKYNDKLKELRTAIKNEAEKEVRKKFIPCSYVNTTEYLSNYIKLNPSNLDTAYSIEKRELWNYPFCEKEKVGYIRLKPGEYKFSNYSSSDSSFRFDYTIQGCLTCLDGNYGITEQIYKDGKLVKYHSGYNLDKMLDRDIEFPIKYKEEQERLAEKEKKKLEEEEQERLVKEEQEKIKQEWLNSPEAKRVMRDKKQLEEKFRKLDLLEGANNTIYSEARRKLKEEREELEERERQSVLDWLEEKIKTGKYDYDDTSSKTIRKKIRESFQIKHDTEEYYYY